MSDIAELARLSDEARKAFEDACVKQGITEAEYNLARQQLN